MIDALFLLLSFANMPIIELETLIHADIEICFDLARSIDFHSLTTAKTKEKAIAGRTSGLIELGETVTWEAVHLGIKQHLTSKITAMEIPFHFRDEMQQGTFRSIKHDHYFEKKGEQTIMKDIFRFESPLGLLGSFFNKVFLTNYMRKFLVERNQMIKEYAEKQSSC